MHESVIEKLTKAATLNLRDTYRHGNIIELPQNGTVIMTGDIHGHKRNLERVFTVADLANNPDTHVILHEIIHGGLSDESGRCLSYKVLLKAVEYKLAYPDQVHFLLSNHDTAYITDNEVMKDSKKMNECMNNALENEFNQDYRLVVNAVKDMLMTQALIALTPNKIMMSHSLPANRKIDKFDLDILEKELTAQDIEKDTPAYVLTWGRRQSQELLDQMSELTGAQIFITGHQPQPEGYKQVGDKMLILASDHNHGCIIRLDLSKHYKIEDLLDNIIPLASIA